MIRVIRVKGFVESRRPHAAPETELIRCLPQLHVARRPVTENITGRLIFANYKSNAQSDTVIIKYYLVILNCKDPHRGKQSSSANLCTTLAVVGAVNSRPHILNPDITSPKIPGKMTTAPLARAFDLPTNKLQDTTHTNTALTRDDRYGREV
ncbi:hypothetical protein J6590_035354 [Homalodisca vitripennis]|nr:hypothetical protein J6590_035354 [Homalodisca vitripennis]